MTSSAPGATPASPNPEGNEGFIQRILSFFAGMGDPESEKKRLLKAIGKDLSRSRYKIFRPKGQEALPGLAKFFFELYRTTAPAQVMLQNANQSAALRAFVIESYLRPEQRELESRLSEEKIRERARTMGLKELQELVKGDLVNFQSIFDGETSRQIDEAYNAILTFLNFISFDYYFLLKKFDSNIPERNFSYKPKFEAINADYVADDLADFLEVFLPLDLEGDWDRIFAALRDYKGAEVIQVEVWKKLVAPLADLRKSQVLDQVIRYVRRDPYWAAESRFPNERIVDGFLEKLKTQVETLLMQIVQERRNSKIDEIATQIFGTAVVLRMKNYTEKANVIFAKKMLGGYTQAPALNYLKAYLIDYFKKDIRELVDLFIIRGKWTTTIQSQQLSDGYHALLEVSEQILRFDDSLADDGEMGARLRAALAKSDRDKEQVKYLRTMLKDVNDRAAAMVTKAGANLVAVGKQVKSLVEDQGKQHHEIVLNWKELELASPQPLKNWLVDVYKKIYFMVQLLQFFAKGE